MFFGAGVGAIAGTACAVGDFQDRKKAAGNEARGPEMRPDVSSSIRNDPACSMAVIEPKTRSGLPEFELQGESDGFLDGESDRLGMKRDDGPPPALWHGRLEPVHGGGSETREER
jgi:hypothetical protein